MSSSLPPTESVQHLHQNNTYIRMLFVVCSSALRTISPVKLTGKLGSWVPYSEISCWTSSQTYLRKFWLAVLCWTPPPYSWESTEPLMDIRHTYRWAIESSLTGNIKNWHQVIASSTLLVIIKVKRQVEINAGCRNDAASMLVTQLVWPRPYHPPHAAVCSSCCHMASKTEIYAAVPPEYQTVVFFSTNPFLH